MLVRNGETLIRLYFWLESHHSTIVSPQLHKLRPSASTTIVSAMRKDQIVPTMVMRELRNGSESDNVHKQDVGYSRSQTNPSVPMTRARTASLHNRTQADRDILKYINNSQTAMNQDGHHPMVRSNSYTIQDVQRQRESIQASIDAGLGG